MKEPEEDFEEGATSVDGRCLCGTVSFTLAGRRSLTDAVCHCSRCRKMTGASYVHFTSFRQGEFTAFQGTEHIAKFTGTKGTPRHESMPMRSTSFCSVCGSTVPRPQQGERSYVAICSGNVLEMPPPQDHYHFYVGSRCPWVQVPESEPQALTSKPGYEDPDQPNLDRYTEEGRITGSCLCGTVSFAAGEPIGMLNCHCSRCRLSRAGAHATNLFVTRRDFEWLGGEQSVRQYKLPGAARFSTAFCADCGGPVPRVGGDPDSRVSIPAGGLDNDPGIGPAGHIFVGSKAPWCRFFDDLPQWQERRQ